MKRRNFVWLSLLTVSGATVGVYTYGSLADLSRRAIVTRGEHLANSAAQNQQLAARLVDADAVGFVPIAHLRTMLSWLVGTRSIYTGSDEHLQSFSLEVRATEITSTFGSSVAMLTVHAAGGGFEAELMIEADILFAGVETRSSDSVMRFSILPRSVALRSNPSILEFAARSWASNVLTQVSVIGIGPLPNVELPLPASLPVDIEGVSLDGTALAVGSGHVTLGGKIPGINASIPLSFGGVVMTPDGVLLVAADASPNSPPTSSTADRDVREAVMAFESQWKLCAGGEAAICVTAKGFEKAAAQVARALPKNVTVQLTGSSGKLAESGGEFRGEAALKDAASKYIVGAIAPFDLQLEQGAITAKTSFQVALQDPSPSVQFQIYWPGGSAGTSAGLVGGAKGSLGLRFAPILVPTKVGQALVLSSEFIEDDFTADVTTNGTLKINELGISADVGKVGMGCRGALGRVADAPRALLMAPRQSIAVLKGGEAGEWKVVPGCLGAFTTLQVNRFDITQRGLVVGVGIAMSQIRNATALREVQAAAAAFNESAGKLAHDATNSLKRSPRTAGENVMFVSIAGIEFGPNNDLVRAAREIGKVFSNVAREGKRVVDAAAKAASDLAEAAKAAAARAESDLRRSDLNPSNWRRFRW